MKRRDWIKLGLAATLLALSAWMVGFDNNWWQDTHNMVVQAQGCTVPITKMDGPPGTNVSIVMLHGLGANRRVMYPLSRSFAASGARVYVLDLPGHGDNTDSFSFERVESCAVAVLESLERNKEIQLDRTVLIGHSMGGALAIRFADYFPTAATVAISPAPMVRVSYFPPGMALPFAAPRRMPNNLLIFTGQYDLPFMAPAARELVAMAGGERLEPEDFRQRRAMKWVTVPHATHTSLIYEPSVWRSSDAWWRQAIPVEVSDRAFYARSIFLSAVLGMIGMMLFFSSVASWLTQTLRAATSSLTSTSMPRGKALLTWALCGMLSVSLLKFVVPLRFLRMYNGDYLASYLLVAGTVLCAFLWRAQSKGGGTNPPTSWRTLAVGGAMGMATMLAFGAWMNWTLTDTWLNAARWMRFPVIALACLPYALAEEWALGTPIAGQWLAAVRRIIFFGALRLLIWLSILFALYAYSNQQILLLVLLFYMAVFSFVVRLGTDAVRRRTSSPAGAAVFAAILMAWFIAAVFPIT